MSELQHKMKCPSCGSENIEQASEQRQLRLPFAPIVSYEAITDHCLDCEMNGDFANANEEVHASALANARRSSAVHMISNLDQNGFGMAYMERALELPARTMMRWKSGDLSAGALALLRLVSTYPWTLDVADAQFDSRYATKRLAQEGLKAMCSIAESSNIATRVAISSYDANGIHGEFHLESSTKPSSAFLGCENTNAPSLEASRLIESPS